MPSNQTPNYALNQWERDDRVLMEDFNADNAKIDAALGAKAEAATVTALSKTVSAHSTALGKKGNCRIWTTSYIGDGTTSRTLTFPAKPLMLFSMGENIILRYIYGRDTPCAPPAVRAEPRVPLCGTEIPSPGASLADIPIFATVKAKCTTLLR